MKTANLLKALSMVIPAVQKKTVISQYDHFVFNKGNVSSYNGDLFFSHPVETEIECSVVASDLIEVMKTVDGKEVELSLDGKTLNLVSDDVVATLSTEVHKDSVVQAITSMNLDSIDWNKSSTAPKDLITGIANCLFSLSKDANDIRNLNHIHIIDNVVESSDGFRGSEYIMDSEMDEVLIPGSSAMVLINQVPECYSSTEGWIHFLDSNDVIFSIRVGDGAFPDVGGLIESMSSDTYSVKLPDSLKNTLDKFTNISDGDLDVYKFVQVDIKDGKLSCSTKKETCNVKKTIDYEDDKVEISFFISPVFLSSIMDKTNIIKINAKEKAAIFSVSNFTHMISLPEE